MYTCCELQWRLKLPLREPIETPRGDYLALGPPHKFCSARFGDIRSFRIYRAHPPPLPPPCRSPQGRVSNEILRSTCPQKDAVPSQQSRSHLSSQTSLSKTCFLSFRESSRFFVCTVFNHICSAHCFKRSTLKSSLYMSVHTAFLVMGRGRTKPYHVHSVWDFVLLYAIYTATTLTESYISPSSIRLPHPSLYPLAWFALWALYGFTAGLVATGLWVVAHECGHQAFSESKTINNAVGWVLHSA
jgi:hypothetical protein